MTSFKIITDEESLEMSGRGAVLGNIWLEISDIAFPSDDWNDFVVIVLAWWLKEVVLLKERKSGLVHEFRFMDGPYYLCLELDDDEQAQIECRERTARGCQTILAGRCRVEEIWNEVISASKTILDIIDKRRWDTTEIQRLKDAWNLAMSTAR